MYYLFNFWKMSIWPNIVIHHATYFNFFLILDPYSIYMSHQYMAIDRGEFKRRRGGRSPP